MDFQEFKIKNIGIEKEKFGRIYSFVDFGNVNYWYEYDERNADGEKLEDGEKLVVDVEKLAKLLGVFSIHRRFYFGLDVEKKKSLRIVSKARKYFDRAVTKPIQKIRHYLRKGRGESTTRFIQEDRDGRYIIIPKCNFDVEICVDAVRYLDQYDTFCLLSGDADFAYLAEFLKRRRKKIILFSSGHVSYWLRRKADLNINSQQVKGFITYIKHKPRLLRGGISISDPHPRTG